MMLVHFVGHVIVSAVIHAVAYAAAWRVFDHMSPTNAVGLAAVVIGVFLVVALVLGLVRRLIFGPRRRW
ncbi:MAG: hypothetical protein ACYCY2_08045 [Acidithiobacillus ferriphilus]